MYFCDVTNWVASSLNKIRQEAQRDLAELWFGHKAMPAWCGSTLAGLPLPCADWHLLQLLPSLSPFTSISLLSSTSHALPFTFPSASVLPSAFSFFMYLFPFKWIPLETRKEPHWTQAPITTIWPSPVSTCLHLFLVCLLTLLSRETGNYSGQGLATVMT